MDTEGKMALFFGKRAKGMGYWVLIEEGWYNMCWPRKCWQRRKDLM